MQPRLPFPERRSAHWIPMQLPRLHYPHKRIQSKRRKSLRLPSRYALVPLALVDVYCPPIPGSDGAATDRERSPMKSGYAKPNFFFGDAGA